VTDRPFPNGKGMGTARPVVADRTGGVGCWTGPGWAVACSAHPGFGREPGRSSGYRIPWRSRPVEVWAPRPLGNRVARSAGGGHERAEQRRDSRTPTPGSGTGPTAGVPGPREGVRRCRSGVGSCERTAPSSGAPLPLRRCTAAVLPAHGRVLASRCTAYGRDAPPGLSAVALGVRSSRRLTRECAVIVTWKRSHGKTSRTPPRCTMSRPDNCPRSVLRGPIPSRDLWRANPSPTR
jgi:hypothetical protein